MILVQVVGVHVEPFDGFWQVRVSPFGANNGDWGAFLVVGVSKHQDLVSDIGL